MHSATCLIQPHPGSGRSIGDRGGQHGLCDEPSDLTNAARLYLREKFLKAKVGISGANFAVAETGTVCVVESEGNGRMCTTLPQTLVTLMGIEKGLGASQGIADRVQEGQRAVRLSNARIVCYV